MWQTLWARTALGRVKEMEESKHCSSIPDWIMVALFSELGNKAGGSDCRWVRVEQLMILYTLYILILRLLVKGDI